MSLPVVAVGAIAFDDGGRVLVVRRGRAPSAGKWSVPGGRVHLGERLEEACAREVKEETGLTVKVGEVAEILDRIGRNGDGHIDHHFVIIDYLITAHSGELCAGDDAAEAAWMSLEDLAAVDTTEGLLPVIARARARAHGENA